jgi:hypothetical protein
LAELDAIDFDNIFQHDAVADFANARRAGHSRNLLPHRAGR